ncbi:hypothetical protein GCM10023321_35280 [Pseudonocardia eucalypti]|uniref:Uncharacterized protein n=2 Tax=Pseudonocardia eucalypti TaxID=648755 RepID=A0ABP9Q691_9PSEU
MKLTQRIRAMRESWDAYAELSERRALLRRPWEEDILHWSYTQGAWVLHGRTLPPDQRRRYGVTRSGWCAGSG